MCGDNQRNIGGLRGGGCGRGGFETGRGLVNCHNFQQPRQYARDCPHPSTTCMYYRATNHTTEYCPILLTKIHDKRNQNNQNVQWIAIETREDEGKKINIVARGGTKIGEYAANQNQNQHQWVRKNTTPQQHLDVHKEKETFT